MNKKRSTGIDWSSLYKSEDWLAVWLGFTVIFSILILPRYMGRIALRFKAWPSKVDAITYLSEHVFDYLALFIYMLIICLVGIIALKVSVRKYVSSFTLMWLLGLVSWILHYWDPARQYGIAYPLWALLIGLLISNVIGVPGWFKPAVRTEMYIKIGLVILGSNILFTDIIRAGGLAMLQSLLVVVGVWYMAYWICIKFKLDKRFSSIMATGVSICGVSAAIAAGGAVKGDPKHIAYVVSMVLLIAIPMLIGEPLIARLVGFSDEVAGAWIGGTIDTTPAVVAAGAFFSEKAEVISAIVKMAQNALIGVAAFFLAVWSILRWEKRSNGEKPRLIEIWFRFPKFILGFILASILITMVITAYALQFTGQPDPLATATDVVKSLMIKPLKTIRYWFFTLAFLCIGLNTNIREFVRLEGGRPAMAFVIAQIANIVYSLAIVLVLWSGLLFPPPI